MRKMAEIVKIDDVCIHPNADLLDICTVKGWKCVAKRGEFKAGELAIYFSIDSWIPTTLAPFLSKGQEPREYDGIKGERLKTIRLRGQISQGLILPLSILPLQNFSNSEYDLYNIGDDVSELLNITKWIAPIPANLAGIVKGAWPSSIPKTDEERCLEDKSVIETDQGVKSIQEICETKLQCKVLSFNHSTQQEEFKPVVDWSIMTRKKGWLKITTKTGKVLTMTKNEKVWLEDLQCYRLAEDLSVGGLVKIYSKN